MKNTKLINRQFIHDKYNGRCAYCGYVILLKDMQVDHCISQRNFEHHIKNNWRIPTHLTHLKINDLNHFDNLMPSCRSCNNYKSSNSLEDFRSEIEKQAKRIYNNMPTVRLAERYGILTLTHKSITFYFEQTIPKK